MSDGEIVLWVFAALVGAAALLFLLQILMVGITFSLLYGRVEHTHSRRALFSDLPAIGVRREFVPVGRRKLAVYHLGEENGKGLVILSHGIRDRAEGYFSEARGFLNEGYRVLLYDATGSGASSGRSQRGLPQSAIDLQRILSWAERQSCFEGLDFYLYGHSWGGYAVCAVFCKGEHPRVKAVCSLAFPILPRCSLRAVQRLPCISGGSCTPLSSSCRGCASAAPCMIRRKRASARRKRRAF